MHRLSGKGFSIPANHNSRKFLLSLSIFYNRIIYKQRQWKTCVNNIAKIKLYLIIWQLSVIILIKNVKIASHFVCDQYLKCILFENTRYYWWSEDIFLQQIFSKNIDPRKNNETNEFVRWTYSAPFTSDIIN